MNATATQRVWSVVTHVLLLFGVAISIFPFYWMFVMASRTTEDIFKFPPELLPGTHLLENIGKVFDSVNLLGSTANTIFVAVVTTVLVLFFDSIAAFAFAKFDFPAKNLLFVVLLVTFMIPSQLSTVPSFVIMANFGWVGSFQALIVPGAVNAFGIFLLRQYAQGAVSAELLDAARIDGCNFWRQYWHVAVPLLRPALAFLGIFTFINAWNDYFWPLVVLIDPGRQTLQVALSQLNGLYNTDYSMVMAGTLLAVIPLIIVFFLGARQFLADLAAGAVKQ
ncbi:cellobiose transport system permease protein [Actinopolymorpha cephalotaxi]|uniref:Cellobiose transport system permease protein n=1 Tax=Actinopolymorpha cephalotaxi TaxID=504797 RepID=A0A1I2UA09_9ACTN|nr:carbohydrate ABC transporter permease [Actinopolymorpha cephalotaxi]NYH86503.1 cellobiose transport system permease protein [Actinopolymorpha cephalotaxi]SFG73974.1 cellobiose transport system permease protein [Actinopolymorpha cephalotaxi]